MSLSVVPAVVSLAVAFLTAIAIVATRRWHLAITADTLSGPQKFHDSPWVPRVGGVAVLAGYWSGVVLSPAFARPLLLATGLSASVALLGGLAEDLTRAFPARWRLVITIVAGGVFCFSTGYVVREVEVTGLDGLLALPLAGVIFTAIAMGGVAHAINMVDGFHGLAAGTTILLLVAFAFVSYRAGDGVLVACCLVAIGSLAGFAILNFPQGRIFLGDGGAYFSGFLLATVAVMLPARNPDLSPWVSIVILAYPLMETVTSSVRKLGSGISPFEPDRRHLHMLVYRHWGTRLVDACGAPSRFANPVSTLLILPLPLASLLAVFLTAPVRNEAWLSCALLAVLYLLAYGMLVRRARTSRSRDREP